MPTFILCVDSVMGIYQQLLKNEEYWWSIHGQNKIRAFLEDPALDKLDSNSRNQLRIMTGLLTGHCHLNRHLNKVGLVNSPECGRCKQASETAAHDLEEISVSSPALCSECRAGKCMNVRVAQKIKDVQSAWVSNVSTLLVFYWSLGSCWI